MVTQDSDHAIGVIVRVKFLLYIPVLWCSLIELLLEGYRRVVRTEHLRRQAFHVRREVLVQRRGL